MPRLAWFSPMPPVRTGIAAYSAEVVEALRGKHIIDVYPERDAHDFIWRHLKEPFDLIVYQLGNSSHHDYIWPYLYRYPGLAVLHDAHLHHARAAALLRTRRADEYRAEFAANHPEAPRGAAELAAAGFDNHLHYSWPMTTLVVEASRATAVHAPLVAGRLRDRHPSAAISVIRMSHGEPIDDERRRAARSRVRAQHGIPDDCVLFGVFGGLTPEKRLPQILEAFDATRRYAPDARLLMAGAPASHYDPLEDVRDRGLTGAITFAGYLDDEAFTDHLAACDVSLNLRWPTAREVSGPWLRAIAAALPTITMDLAHMADVPALDPRTWKVTSGATRADALEPVTIAIDVVDEDHSLRLAMRRLAADETLRARLGAAALACWQREHSREGMVEDYEQAISLALDRSVTDGPDASTLRLPRHLATSGDEKLHDLIAPFGVSPDLWSTL